MCYEDEEEYLAWLTARLKTETQEELAKEEEQPIILEFGPPTGEATQKRKLAKVHMLSH